MSDYQALWSGKKLGVIGGGNMAEALVRGVVAAELVHAPAVVVYDVATERRDVFASFGCVAAETPHEVLCADVVLLATKPQKAEEALHGLELRDHQLLVSIAAGIPCSRLEGWLKGGGHVVRVMPNTPLLVGMGASALARGSRADEGDLALAMGLFDSCGVAIEVDEDKLDAVTALSGSGPAYLFRFAEALRAGAEELGLDGALAARLTAAMLRGSAEMLARFGNPGKLREQVTSPGGTTAAALAVLTERDFDHIVADALEAARDRSVELGRGE